MFGVGISRLGSLGPFTLFSVCFVGWGWVGGFDMLIMQVQEGSGLLFRPRVWRDGFASEVFRRATGNSLTRSSYSVSGGCVLGLYGQTF